MRNKPSVKQLQEWLAEGGCEATDGCWVEPDGHCEHGKPSWLPHLNPCEGATRPQLPWARPAPASKGHVMPLAKSQRFGAVVATRYRDGTCTATCNRSNCRAYAEPRGWRRTMRLAREHAAAHAHTDAHDADTPWGIPAHELPRAARAARKPRQRLAAIAVVLLLAVLAFGVTVVSVAGQAGSKPVPTTSTTTTPAPYEYIPTPAGLPCSSNAGGGR